MIKLNKTIYKIKQKKTRKLQIELNTPYKLCNVHQRGDHDVLKEYNIHSLPSLRLLATNLVSRETSLRVSKTFCGLRYILKSNQKT